jgi:excisionase family DNA binding protein
MEPGYLGLKELAEYSSLSESTLRGLLHEIPHLRIRRKILVKRSDFDYWAKRRQKLHNTVNPLIKELADRIMGAA